MRAEKGTATSMTDSSNELKGNGRHSMLSFLSCLFQYNVF